MTETLTTKERLTSLSDRVDDLFADYIAAQEKFLREAGWEHSSAHPDFRWRWSKTLDGRNYSLPANDAIELERMIQDV